MLPYKSDSSVAKIDYSGANPTPGLYVANASKYIYSSETATSYSYTIPRFSMFEITKIGTNGTRLYGTFKTSSGATVTGWINNNSDRIIQLSSTEGAMSAEEIAREELQATVNAANKIRHYNYTEAQILEKLAKGEDVTVLALWTVKQLYFSVKVNGGEVIAHGDMDKDGNYLAYRGVTVKANDASEGMKFVCWTDHNGNIKSYDAEYKFYIAEDTELTAVYMDADATVDYEVLVDVVMDATSSTTSNTILFSWNVPEQETGYTFVKAGLLLVRYDNYNEETFEVGTSDSKVTQYSPKTEFQIPANVFSVNKSGVNSGDTWVVKAWVQYLDTNGELCVAYSDVVIETKP